MCTQSLFWALVVPSVSRPTCTHAYINFCINITVYKDEISMIWLKWQLFLGSRCTNGHTTVLMTPRDVNLAHYYHTVLGSNMVAI